MKPKLRTALYFAGAIIIAALISAGVTMQLYNQNRKDAVMLSTDEYAALTDILALDEIISDIQSDYYYDAPSRDALIRAAARGMVSELNDPYAQYFTDEEYQKYLTSISGSYDGIGVLLGQPTEQGADITALTIVPEWRRKGYGSYLLKEVLRSLGGYDKESATVFTAPLPADAGELAFWAKFGFAAEGSGLCRRRTPDLTAVKLVQDFLAARLADPRLCIDATCGNGGDTAFLCRLVGKEGRVLGFDIQPEAIASTRQNLARKGLAAELHCDSHANLLQYVQPGTVDAVMFNFGWLPGADHGVFSHAQSSIPALEAALEALRPGGVLSAILYSGKVIGSDEKTEILQWMRSRPLKQCTALVCGFANWADTAPLPCFLLKK